MERMRPSAPWGDPAWLHLNADDYFAETDRQGRRIAPELFRMIRRFRRARIRLVVEVALLVAAVVLVAVIPNLGEIVLVTAVGVVTLFDLLLVLHLHRRIEEAWRDLPMTAGE